MDVRFLGAGKLICRAQQRIGAIQIWTIMHMWKPIVGSGAPSEAVLSQPEKKKKKEEKGKDDGSTRPFTNLKYEHNWSLLGQVGLGHLVGLLEVEIPGIALFTIKPDNLAQVLLPTQRGLDPDQAYLPVPHSIIDHFIYISKAGSPSFFSCEKKCETMRWKWVHSALEYHLDLSNINASYKIHRGWYWSSCRPR